MNILFALKGSNFFYSYLLSALFVDCFSCQFFDFLILCTCSSIKILLTLTVVGGVESLPVKRKMLIFDRKCLLLEFYK